MKPFPQSATLAHGFSLAIEVLLFKVMLSYLHLNTSFFSSPWRLPVQLSDVCANLVLMHT